MQLFRTLVTKIRNCIAFPEGRLLLISVLASGVVLVGVGVGVSALIARSRTPAPMNDTPTTSVGSEEEGVDSIASPKSDQPNATTPPKSPATNNPVGSGSTPANSGGSSNPSSQPGTSTPAPTTSAVKVLLAKHVTGSLHEAIPHGVPTNYEQRTKAVLKYPTAPNEEMTYINIRGAVYVDESNYRAPNVRVEIMNCQSYGLRQSSNAWEKLIDLSPGKLAGRGWHEDFSTPGDQMYTNIRTEASGSKSVITYDGYNLHFFNNTNLAPLVYVGYNYSEFVTACSSRLILEDASGPDNRSTAAYIITTGNDWKKSNNTCTVNQSGATLCYAIGSGRYLKVTNSWRRVIFSSLDSTDLDTKPLPPEQLFLNPDGSFGN